MEAAAEKLPAYFLKRPDVNHTYPEKFYNYYPFGGTLAGTSYQRLGAQRNKYRYNGKELQDDLGLDWYDYGRRMYDPMIGRFYVIDPLSMIFQSFTPYQYGLNNPLRFEDWEGLGPGDRVKIAKRYVGTPYSKEKGINTTYTQRTGLTLMSAGYMHFDCSEFVYRVLESDGLVQNRGGNTGSLKTEFNNSEKWIKSNSPEIGDVFLWRDNQEEKGHTGIVTGIERDEEGNITGVEITHAKGSEYGVVTEVKSLTYFTEHWGWEGFNRPVKEFRPEKIEKKEGETMEEWLARAANRLARMQAKAEINRKKREKKEKERERRRKAKEEQNNN